jgi:hypothetical protein
MLADAFLNDFFDGGDALLLSQHVRLRCFIQVR